MTQPPVLPKYWHVPPHLQWWHRDGVKVPRLLSYNWSRAASIVRELAGIVEVRNDARCVPGSLCAQCHSLGAPLHHASVEATGGVAEVDGGVETKELVHVWEWLVHGRETRCSTVGVGSVRTEF